MWRRVGRAALWVLAVLLVALGGGSFHYGFSGYRQDPVGTFVGLAFGLTGAAIYWHALRDHR